MIATLIMVAARRDLRVMTRFPKGIE